MQTPKCPYCKKRMFTFNVPLLGMEYRCHCGMKMGYYEYLDKHHRTINTIETVVTFTLIAICTFILACAFFGLVPWFFLLGVVI